MEKDDKANLMEMASEVVNEIDSEDSNTDEDCEYYSLTLSNYKED